jgi:uncharacterized protein involved in propanediol utilization
MLNVGRGMSHGTFGELLQGALPGHLNNCLVSYPINVYSTAIFSPDKEKSNVTVVPHHKEKSRVLAERLLKYFNVNHGGILHVESELDEGKGLASSTADLIATSRSIAATLNVNIPIKIMLDFFREIEPTDGIMYNELAVFYHRRVQIRKKLGVLPKTVVIAIDEGGTIDTIRFNKENQSFSSKEKFLYKDLFEDLTFAVAHGDLFSVGKIATKSAILNQNINPKKFLNTLISLCEDTHSLGVIVTHSGPCAGILLNPLAPFYADQKQDITSSFKLLGLQYKIYHSLDFQENKKPHTPFFEERREAYG